MKKALFVLLLLAFVAGGLFAQFSFSGLIDAGVGLALGDSYKNAGGDADPRLGILGKANGANGGRYQFQASYTNEAKNAGMVVRFRFAGSVNNTIQPRAVYGWLKFFDGMLTTYGGRFGGGAALFSTFDPLSDGANLYDNSTGLFVLVKPIDMFSIGFVASLPPANNDPFGTAHPFAKGQGTVVLGVAVPDIMNINAQFAFSQQAAAANLNGNIRAFLSFDVTAIKSLKLQLTMQMFGLQDFKVAGAMIFSEFFAFNGIKNLGLNLGFQEGVTGSDVNDDLFFKAWFWATYALAGGKVVPRLDFIFAVGNNYGNGASLYNPGWFTMNADINDPDAVGFGVFKDVKNLMLMPSVQFKVGGSYIEVGYALWKGLGKNGAFDGANHYLFANLSTSF